MVPDPYTHFLELPPGPRPPDHYVLLGVSRFERDRGVVHRAALRRIQMLKEWALVRDAAVRSDVELLLREVTEAQMVLESPARREAYEAWLCVTYGIDPPVAAEAPAPPLTPPPAQPPPASVVPPPLPPEAQAASIPVVETVGPAAGPPPPPAGTDVGDDDREPDRPKLKLAKVSVPAPEPVLPPWEVSGVETGDTTPDAEPESVPVPPPVPPPIPEDVPLPEPEPRPAAARRGGGAILVHLCGAALLLALLATAGGGAMYKLPDLLRAAAGEIAAGLPEDAIPTRPASVLETVLTPGVYLGRLFVTDEAAGTVRSEPLKLRLEATGTATVRCSTLRRSRSRGVFGAGQPAADSLEGPWREQDGGVTVSLGDGVAEMRGVLGPEGVVTGQLIPMPSPGRPGLSGQWYAILVPGDAGAGRPDPDLELVALDLMLVAAPVDDQVLAEALSVCMATMVRASDSGADPSAVPASVGDGEQVLPPVWGDD